MWYVFVLALVVYILYFIRNTFEANAQMRMLEMTHQLFAAGKIDEEQFCSRCRFIAGEGKK
jgi:uncharacterized membrane protein